MGTFNRLRAVSLSFLVRQAKRANSENDYTRSGKQKKKRYCSQYRTSVPQPTGLVPPVIGSALRQRASNKEAANLLTRTREA